MSQTGPEGAGPEDPAEAGSSSCSLDGEEESFHHRERAVMYLLDRRTDGVPHEEQSAYKCRHCNTLCLNPRLSIPAVSKTCFPCIVSLIEHASLQPRHNPYYL